MMKKQRLWTLGAILLILSFTGCTFAKTYGSVTIVVDHAAIADFDNIPVYWINEAKKLWINILGESHSQAYRDGVDYLEAIDSLYQATGQEQDENNGLPYGPTDEHLRVSRIKWNDGWSGWGTGEEDFWTTSHAVESIQAHISYCNGEGGIPVAVVGFGWCWDMHGDLSGSPDPIYGCRWGGCSNYDDGSTSGNYGAWGLDNGDIGTVNTEDYCIAIESLDLANPATVVIYTTGPADNEGEDGYQRYLKHEFIRNWVQTNGGVMFDYADILSYNQNGTQETVEWNGHEYPVLAADYRAEETGHISNDGAVELAKGIWYLAARVAGWDGIVE